ncbi:MAG: hypothetical protein GY934_16980 [Gammaproteobacteria bacterium]|nr:hypothetical protein [Gammaproteobacteria bacterium]
MAIPPISNTALQGIQRGLQGIRKNASEIASTRNVTEQFPSKNMVREMVELHQNSNQTAASVKAFKAMDQAIGSLLDIKA